MVDILSWIIIISLFVVSFVGILYPVIPSSLVLWGGFLLYHFLINSNELSLSFWILMAFFTMVMILSDIVVNSYFVKKFGGSEWGERGAAIAVIVGSFIMPPFGILFIPPLTVFIIEMVQKRTVKEAVRASFASFIGFMSGALAKVVIQVIMIIWFFIVIIF